MIRRAALTCLAVLVGLAAWASPAAPVDLNRASFAELMRVPGMTATWSARIVRFRPYRTKLDLLQNGVVTPEVYRRISNGVVAHRNPTDGGHR